MNWSYFELVALTYSDEFMLIDEEGQLLTKDGSPLYFTSFDDAEAYLVKHDIRGTVR